MVNEHWNWLSSIWREEDCDGNSLANIDAKRLGYVQVTIESTDINMEQDEVAVQVITQGGVLGRVNPNPCYFLFDVFPPYPAPRERWNSLAADSIRANPQWRRSLFGGTTIHSADQLVAACDEPFMIFA
jgi:hypothetical protein